MKMLRQQTQRITQINIDEEPDKIYQQARARGREAGLKKQHNPEATQPCEHEQAIHRDVADLKTKVDQDFEYQMDHNDADLRESISKVDGAELDECPAMTKQQFEAHNALYKTLLAAAASVVDETSRCRKAMEDQYGKVSSSAVGSYLLHIAVLLTSLLGESGLNAFLFGQAHELGILGGAIQSFAIAAFSIAASFSWGAVLRSAIDRGGLLRALGLMGTAVFGGLLISYHGIVAWYRTVLVHGDDPIDAVTSALGFFVNYGLGLQDVHSAFLLVIGVFLGILACCSGYRSHEARIQAANARIVREHEAAEAKFQNVQGDNVLDGERIHEEMLRETDHRFQTANQAVSELRLGISKAKRLRHTHQAMTQRLKDIDETAIQTFRLSCGYVEGEHASHPPYWQEEIDGIDDSFELDMSTVDDAETLLADLGKRLQVLRDKRKAANDKIRQMSSSHLVDAMHLGETIRQGAGNKRLTRVEPANPLHPLHVIDIEDTQKEAAHV